MLQRVKVPAVLFASELPPACGEEYLREICLDYGPITKVEVVSDDIVSFARIYFECVEDAFSALKDLEEMELFGETVKYVNLYMNFQLYAANYLLLVTAFHFTYNI